jgi:hypothetical protein
VSGSGIPRQVHPVQQHRGAESQAPVARVRPGRLEFGGLVGPSSHMIVDAVTETCLIRSRCPILDDKDLITGRASQLLIIT